jgi:GH24 family phage-related lysozyme (muramidase)
VYKDSKGIHTIGHGFNLESPHNAPVFKQVTGFTVQEAMKGKAITKDQQHALLEHTIAQADKDVKQLVPNYDQLEPAQQDALTNFVFNVGLTTALKFKNTFAAIRAFNGKEAAARLRKSDYYKQVGPRGERIAKILETIKPPKPSSE